MWGTKLKRRAAEAANGHQQSTRKELGAVATIRTVLVRTMLLPRIAEHTPLNRIRYIAAVSAIQRPSESSTSLPVASPPSSTVQPEC